MKSGIYFDFDASTYHNDPCEKPSLNYSTAKEIIKRDPWHAMKKHPRLGGERWTPTKQMDEGSIVHALLLGQPLDGLIEVLNADSYRTKKAKADRDAAKESGKLVILEKRFDELKAGIHSMLANLRDAGVTLDGSREVTVVWDVDCMCRTRIDHLSEDMLTIDDLKCSDDPDPYFLDRHIVDLCYDLQAAAEIEAIETLAPETAGRIRFRDVFIWTSEPWFVVVSTHSESMLDLGRRRWQRAKRTWIECLESGKWPGPPNNVTAHAPNWAINQEYGELA